jgi:hypothetical protein
MGSCVQMADAQRLRNTASFSMTSTCRATVFACNTLHRSQHQHTGIDRLVMKTLGQDGAEMSLRGSRRMRPFHASLCGGTHNESADIPALPHLRDQGSNTTQLPDLCSANQ